ncbi:hypothetical protein [Flavobacterium sp.]|uniref:hypothetical protein n=1 Tax=Flavobacterium sp. TaxID=239 RepID=UPI003F6A4052
MALDTRYMLAPALQHLFRDKDTGKPLSFGKVFFYRDIARTILKPIFQLTGFPPNYSYVQIPTNGDGSISLNSVGAFDTAIYYFPFDENGNEDLYYIEVFATDINENPTVLQFTREGYPNFSNDESNEPAEENYISNGKFLLHRDIGIDGSITMDTTEIAYGGWSYDRSVSGSPSDIVLFNRFNSFVSTPPDNPRYAVNIISSSTHAGGGYKHLRIKFSNVNRFGSTDADEKFTFGFYGKSNGGNISIELAIVKNYGSGGSPSPSEIIPVSGSSVSLTSGYQLFNIALSFGDNISKNIGTNNDDFVQIALSFPIDETWNLEFTDFFLIDGEKLEEDFPISTDRMDIMSALGGGIDVPSYDGSQLGLPIILTETGFKFSDSEVGHVKATVSSDIPFGYLDCNGNRYDPNEKSSDGIPYSRLHEKIYDIPNNYPRFGTGPDYFISFITEPNKIDIMNNNAGVVTAASDGSTPTGFTIKMISDGFNGGTNLRVAVTEVDFLGITVVLTEGMIIGETTLWGSVGGVTTFFQEVINLVNTFSVNRIIFESGSSMTPGVAFPFYTINTPNGSEDQYTLWFQVNGVGSAPAGPNPIRVDVDSVDDGETVGDKASIGMSGKAQVLITTVAGASITPGSFFNVYAATSGGEQLYYPWYRVNGVGIDPQLSGGIGIPIDVLDTDTDAIIATKTIGAINRRFFAVPDLRGQFIRGFNDGSGKDPGALTRYNTKAPFSPGDFIGSEQRDDVIIHRHDSATGLTETCLAGIGQSFPTAGLSATYPSDTLSIDGNEVRPSNISLKYIIKY